MCGRFVQFSPIETVQKVFNIATVPFESIPSYNVAPTQKILTVVKHDNENKLERFYWGLVPFWAKDIKIGSRMINARVETVADKPAFRNAFKKRRCLIVADGFYEWKGKKGNKQPYFITIPSREPFAFAGLWELWSAKEKDEDTIYKSCAIITTVASESIKQLHDRMPVILMRDYHDRWLNPKEQDPKKLENVLKNGLIRDMQYYPISQHVNSPMNNDPECIRPITE